MGQTLLPGRLVAGASVGRRPLRLAPLRLPRAASFRRLFPRRPQLRAPFAGQRFDGRAALPAPRLAGRRPVDAHRPEGVRLPDAVGARGALQFDAARRRRRAFGACELHQPPDDPLHLGNVLKTGIDN